jgi:hypothetical protein
VPSSCGPWSLGTDSCCKKPLEKLKQHPQIHTPETSPGQPTPPNIARNILISKSYMRFLHSLRFLDFSRPFFLGGICMCPGVVDSAWTSEGCCDWHAMVFTKTNLGAE